MTDQPITPQPVSPPQPNLTQQPALSVTAVFARIAQGRATAVDYEQYLALWDQRAAANAAARRHAA